MRLFVPRDWVDPDAKQVTVVDNAFHHLVRVMRKAKGDPVQIFDGHGGVYDARVDKVSRARATLAIEKVLPRAQDARHAVTLACAVLKGRKMTWVIQKATEIGVHTIVPLLTRRTVAQPGDKAPEKIAKWEKIAIEASKQCGGAFVPNIHHPIAMDEYLRHCEGFDGRLLAWEGPEGMDLRRWATQAIPAWGERAAVGVVLFVGPEGGFEDSEVDCAKAAGCTPIRLPGNILRSETAAFLAAALLLYELKNST